MLAVGPQSTSAASLHALLPDSVRLSLQVLPALNIELRAISTQARPLRFLLAQWGGAAGPHSLFSALTLTATANAEAPWQLAGLDPALHRHIRLAFPAEEAFQTCSGQKADSILMQI